MDSQIQDLIGEFTFQRCLLESHGDTVKVGREETEAMLRDEIRSLEGQFRELRGERKLRRELEAEALNIVEGNIIYYNIFILSFSLYVSTSHIYLFRQIIGPRSQKILTTRQLPWQLST